MANACCFQQKLLLWHPELLYNFRIQFNAWSHDLTLSPTAKGGGSVGVACFIDSLILELSDSVLGVGEAAAPVVGEGSLFFAPAFLGGERSLLDLGLVAACWCLLFSKLGLALCECGAGGGLCFTGELGLISPSEYRLPRLT